MFAMNDIIYWVWLSLKNRYGSSDAPRLLKYFPGGAREIYEASQAELLRVHECNASFIKRLDNHDLGEAERILEFCFSQGIQIISCASPRYPKRLHSLYNKPIVLYARGQIQNLDSQLCVSIVGTRSMTDYGKHTTFTIARQLIGYGAIIISGAAYGIDSSANNTAVYLEAPTVAVLGSGVNVPYPSDNKDMLDKIASNGLVLSEFPPNTGPNRGNFPIRNRIISGLCDALLVVEAPEKSGALITARIAAEQGRPVYAIPGNIGAPQSMGTNNLIRDGAKLVTRAEDILEDFTDRFDLRKIDAIVNSDKYLRYEYTKKTSTTNASLSRTKPAKSAEKGPEPSRSTPLIQKKVEQTDIKPEPREEQIEIPIKAQIEAQTKKEESDKTDGVITGSDIFSAVHVRVLKAMPSGVAVTPDEIAQHGIPTNQVLASLTILEMASAVEAMAGGKYKKCI